jgi:sec-independent protein translocase protein TatB
MLDIGWPELMLIAVVALIVIGPRDLPAAIRTVTTIIRKVRGMAAEFQGGLEEIARDSGIDDVKKSVEDVISYDAEAALKNIAEIEGEEFNLDSDENEGSNNSILDPGIQSQLLENDPELISKNEDSSNNEQLSESDFNKDEIDSDVKDSLPNASSSLPSKS